MAANVPSISTLGWVKGVAEKLDLLLSYYFVSENSQSNTYAGKVISLPYQIQQYGSDPINLKQSMTDTLTVYLERYFDAVDVSITTEVPLETDPNRIHITVDIIVTQNGVRASAGKLIETINSKLSNIFDINNNVGGS